jgi:tRNA (cytidine/uridine-2'-O-)-methyltransferase
MEYKQEDSFLFGPESRGLSDWIFKEFPDIHPILIPMAAESRSLNVANAVSVIGYEAWRQNGFFGRRGTRVR